MVSLGLLVQLHRMLQRCNAVPNNPNALRTVPANPCNTGCNNVELCEQPGADVVTCTTEQSAPTFAGEWIVDDYWLDLADVI